MTAAPELLTEEREERISLHYRDHKSDKDYVVSLERQDDGWVVNFAYGKHGSTLRPGSKTAKGPVAYAAAKKIYDKVVTGQLSEGYQVVDGTMAFTNVTVNQTLSGLVPQLLNAIDDDAAQPLLDDDGWAEQEKKDGERLLLRRQNGEVDGTNKKGFLCGLAQPVVDAAHALGGEFELDGEAMRGGRYCVFDLLSQDGVDLRALPFTERYARLVELLRKLNSDTISLVPAAFTTAEKRALYARMQAEGREGVVFKQVSAPYVPGRPNSGGSQLKRKFWKTASVLVAAVNDQRSVQITVKDGDAWLGVGNCTIPSNAAVPAVGAVIEVRYIYAHRGGALSQTSYLGERTDVDADECLIDQLEFKVEECV